MTPFKTLIKPAKPVEHGGLLAESDLTGPMHASRVCVADVNGDGKLDLLVGDSVTLIAPAKGITPAEFKNKYAKWQEDFEDASSKLCKAGSDEKEQAKAREEYRKIFERRDEFMQEDMTGFVWLYLRK
jgi:hypothetical protein